MKHLILSLLLFVSLATHGQRPLRDVPYHLLSNIELLLDATGAVTNTDNDYATVDGSGNITAAKSVSPGTTGRNFTVVGSGVTLGADGSFAFNGSGRLRSSSTNATWNFLNYKATLTDLKYTIFAVVKMGTSFRPTGNYALLGNNGESSGNTGVAYYYNNSSASIVDNLTGFISRGTSNQFIARTISNNLGMSNKYFVFTIQADLSLTGSLKLRFFVNDQYILSTVGGSTSTSPVSTPTYALEVGGAGNSTFPLIGNIKELIITSTSVTQTVRDPIIRALMNKHNITKSDANYVSTDFLMNQFDQIATSKYHLLSIISQNPTSPYNVLSVSSEGTAHVYDAGKKLIGRLSSNAGKPHDNSFGSQFNIFDPASTEAVQDGGGGYDANGRFHIICDTHTSLSVGATHKVYHLYSDNNGSSWTTTDITSSINTSDGMNTFRFYGGLIHNNGVWMKPYYKLQDEGDASFSAVYILRSTDGVNWTSITVKAKNGTYVNESSMVALDNDNLILLARHEVTNEWIQYKSADNGLTWTVDNNVTFGLTITSANPVQLKWFNHKGTRVIVAYAPDRANDVLYAIYAKASDLITSGAAAWDLDTKVPIWRSNETDYHLHYGDVVHINNTFNAIGIWPYDPYPSVGAGTVNELRYFTMPSWHLPLIESELGL